MMIILSVRSRKLVGSGIEVDMLLYFAVVKLVVNVLKLVMLMLLLLFVSFFSV